MVASLLLFTLFALQINGWISVLLGVFYVNWVGYEHVLQVWWIESNSCTNHLLIMKVMALLLTDPALLAILVQNILSSTQFKACLISSTPNCVILLLDEVKKFDSFLDKSKGTLKGITEYIFLWLSLWGETLSSYFGMRAVFYLFYITQ